jgi:hypothetical protein
VEQGQLAQRPLLGGVQKVPRPLDDGEQGLVPVRRAAVAAAQEREPVFEAPVDLLQGHGARPGRGELDRQRQAVQAADDARHDLLGQAHARPRGDSALAEELDGVGRAQLAELVDVLGGDGERGAAGGEHAQVGHGDDQERHELGDRPDQVLAVVQDEEARGLPELLGDARADVGALRGRQRAARASGPGGR